MNKFAIIAIVITSISSTAQAQDTSYNWTGTYIGAHVGYFTGKPHYTEPGFPDYSRNPSLNGFTGGAMIGYNIQTNGMVLGMDADVGVVDADEDADLTAAFNDYTAFDFDWNAHIRARAGVPIGASGKTLVYIAGGVAIARLTVDDIDLDWDHSSRTHVGWTLGAGAERAVRENVIVRLEYLYDDYGSKNHLFTDGGDTYTGRWDPKAHTIRAGVSVGL